jgi:hypothetical protein
MIERLRELIEAIDKANYMDAGQTRELFNINNELFPDIKEFGTGCASCRARVFNRLKGYINK